MVALFFHIWKPEVNKIDIILASSSPRRLKILRENGINPIVISTDSDESIPDDASDASEVAQILSMRKAKKCRSLLKAKEALIIAADTIVVCKDLTHFKKFGILGKPKSKEEARFMIENLQGKSHKVITGCAVIRYDFLNEKEISFCEETEVHCKPMNGKEIEEYILTDEPYDKAGGYGIQGEFGNYIDHIEGDYNNVVGLPIDRLIKEINGIL